MKKLMLLCLIPLGACATIFDGSTQDIQVNTNPPGANCKFDRNGQVIANINDTPGGTTIEKSKYDIIIKCNKPGYSQATYIDHSGLAGVTFVDVIWWPSALVDSAAGSDNKYDSPVNITLPRL